MFTKKDLKTGDVVVRENGIVGIYVEPLKIFAERTGYDKFDEIDDFLKSSVRGFDIVKVYRPREGHHCQFDKEIYERGELMFDRVRDAVKEMTIAEIEEKLGYRIKIKGE